MITKCSHNIASKSALFICFEVMFGFHKGHRCAEEINNFCDAVVSQVRRMILSRRQQISLEQGCV